MREILFRGKTVQGEWIEGFLTHYCNAWYIVYQGGPRVGYEVIPETVGQYTGLTDKNGKKIFEGNIVEFYIDDLRIVGKVFYSKKSTAFKVWYELPEQKLFVFSKILCDCEDIKVIGNIHDNPELLEEADNE